jgi:hypothetical protein
MDHSPRFQFDNEEGEQRAEEEGSRWEKVTGPDLLNMSVQEGRLVLSVRSSPTHVSHVLLDRAFADVKPQLEEFAADSLRSEDGDFAPPCL